VYYSKIFPITFACHKATCRQHVAKKIKTWTNATQFFVMFKAKWKLNLWHEKWISDFCRNLVIFVHRFQMICFCAVSSRNLKAKQKPRIIYDNNKYLHFSRFSWISSRKKNLRKRKYKLQQTLSPPHPTLSILSCIHLYDTWCA
jgi:hypothetical protein